MKQIGYLILFLNWISIWASSDFTKYPPPWEIAIKAGYSNNDLDSSSFWHFGLSSEYRSPIQSYSILGGGYWRIRFPFKFYGFPTRSHGSWLLETKIRPEIGPPLAPWLPNGFLDLGYLYAPHDWLAHRNSSTIHALLLGGWFSVPLLAPRRGTFMVSGATSIKGTQLVRFSCYLDWMIGNHWGLTLHGDNFMRTHSAKTYSYGSFNLGFLWQW